MTVYMTTKQDFSEQKIPPDTLLNFQNWCTMREVTDMLNFKLNHLHLIQQLVVSKEPLSSKVKVG